MRFRNVFILSGFTLGTFTSISNLSTNSVQAKPYSENDFFYIFRCHVDKILYSSKGEYFYDNALEVEKIREEINSIKDDIRPKLIKEAKSKSLAQLIESTLKVDEDIRKDIETKVLVALVKMMEKNKVDDFICFANRAKEYGLDGYDKAVISGYKYLYWKCLDLYLSKENATKELISRKSDFFEAIKKRKNEIMAPEKEYYDILSSVSELFNESSY